MPVNLTKGQKISLDKEAGQTLQEITMGLGWDQKKAKGLFGGFKNSPEIDLDSSCLLFAEGRNLMDVVWFRQLQSKDGSIQHSGDNRTGAGTGDDEQIMVNLGSVPPQVTSLVFTINSFTGESFEKIENAFCRLVNRANGQEIARYNLSGGARATAQVMVKLYRHNGEWKMHAIGEPGQGRTFMELVPMIQSYL
jgi:tellurium resistance protein TerZ